MLPNKKIYDLKSGDVLFMLYTYDMIWQKVDDGSPRRFHKLFVMKLAYDAKDSIKRDKRIYVNYNRSDNNPLGHNIGYGISANDARADTFIYKSISNAGYMWTTSILKIMDFFAKTPRAYSETDIFLGNSTSYKVTPKLLSLLLKQPQILLRSNQFK